MSKSNIPNNTTLTPPKTTTVLPHVTNNLHEVYTLGKKHGWRSIRYHISLHTQHNRFECKYISKKKLVLQRGLWWCLERDLDNAPFIWTSKCCEDRWNLWGFIYIFFIWLWRFVKVRNCLIGLCRRVIIVIDKLLRWLWLLLKLVILLVLCIEALNQRFFLFNSVDEDVVLKTIKFGPSLFNKKGFFFFFLFLFWWDSFGVYDFTIFWCWCKIEIEKTNLAYKKQTFQNQ